VNEHQATKLGTLWGGVALSKLGIYTWSDVAAVLAAVYSLILIGEWCWKKFLKAYFKRRGWIA